MNSGVINDMMRSVLADVQPGTVVAVNAETGDYVTAATEDAALEAFEAKYGWGVPAVVHVVTSH
jgi:hypothetical protein